MFDTTSYEMGKTAGVKKGTGVVIIEEGGDYTFTDANSDGNVVMVESEGE